MQVRTSRTHAAGSPCRGAARGEAFHLEAGFTDTAAEPMTSFARIKDVKAMLGEAWHIIFGSPEVAISVFT